VFRLGEWKHANTFVKKRWRADAFQRKEPRQALGRVEKADVYGETAKSLWLQLIRKVLYSRSHSCP
jgi:hypothetical protein